MKKPAPMIFDRDEDAEDRALAEGEAALADGRVVPHEDVKRWLMSWGTDKVLPPPKCK